MWGLETFLKSLSNKNGWFLQKCFSKIQSNEVFIFCPLTFDQLYLHKYKGKYDLILCLIY